MIEKKRKTIPRDISWLSFNARVLQEANDPSVPLGQRLRFLGIFSNNLDEFYRVRVATLKRMIELGNKAKMHLENSPGIILEEILTTVLDQQNEFNRIWNNLLQELRKEKIFIVNEKQLNREQQKFVATYFDEEVRSEVIPLMVEAIPQFPYLRDKSIYLGVVMSKKDSAYNRKFALIEVPTRNLPRFILLPSPRPDEHYIILLEDVVRFSLPNIFSYFGYDRFSSHVFKITKDAEIDIDNDINSGIIQSLEKGLKNRRKGRPVRFVYDKEIDPGLLEYLIRKLNLSSKDNLIPGGRIHNFRHFMEFPFQIIKQKVDRRKPFVHPLLKNTLRVTDVVMEKDVLLHIPYHSYNSVIDLLREAAFDPEVTEIKVTAYRLARNSKIINALINAVRNGKKVTVVLELRARFEEEANLEWKERLELEGVRVLLGIPNLKVHAKLCLIKKRTKNNTIHYGFVSTGNLNEKTAAVYSDHCLLTSDRFIMADVNRVFNFFEKTKEDFQLLKSCKTLLVCPVSMRKELNKFITKEIKNALSGKPASITLKVNSISDEDLIGKLYDAAKAGVEIKMIIRGICCMLTEGKKFKFPIKAISIVDEYLEHSRIIVFHNNGNEKVFLSSADWMVRNLDHRVEVAVPIVEEGLKQELKDFLEIQLSDNVKARIWNNELSNEYVKTKGKKIRSQMEVYNYLYRKANPQPANEAVVVQMNNENITNTNQTNP
ncbi:MAG: polyphosphate kinase 1 [Sphingobacteriales bacterium]|nr:MAG: polyphosphate kinase 1 [Sphingobacteriales bacterium]